MITQKFLGEGFFVRNLDNLMFNNLFAIDKFSKNKNYEFIHGDLRSDTILSKSIKDVDNVIILAGIVGDPLSKKYPEETAKINEVGIINCLKYLNNKKMQSNFCLHMFQLRFDKENELADENFELNPLSFICKEQGKY